MNFTQIALACSHAAVLAPESEAADAAVYLTDESGQLLTDPEGNLIVLG